VDNKKKFKGSYDQDDEAIDNVLNEDEFDMEEVIDPKTGLKSKKKELLKRMQLPNYWQHISSKAVKSLCNLTKMEI